MTYKKMSKAFLSLVLATFLFPSSYANTLDQFKKIFAQHSSVMLLIEPNSGKIIDANNAALVFYQYSFEKLKTMSIQQINMLNNEQISEDRRLAKLEKRNFFIFRHQIASGEIKTVEVFSSPITIDNQVLLFSIIHDVSQHRANEVELWHYQTNLEALVDQQLDEIQQAQKERKLFFIVCLLLLSFFITFLLYLLKKTKETKDAHHTLSQIVEQSPVAIMTTDKDANISFVNTQFLINSGYEEHELIGQKPSLLKHKKSNDTQYAQLWQTLKTGAVWTGEFHSQRKDGEAYWEHATIYPLKNTRGEIQSYVGIKEDISQRKEDERQLRLASTVFKTATEAVMVTDADNKIQAVNNAFTTITGYTKDEAIGQTPLLLHSRHHSHQFYIDMLDALSHEDKWQGEIWSKRKNGEVYYEWLAVTTLRDNSGKVEAYVSLFSDITKRKQSEDKIKQQANFDSLTGLANRNLFTERFLHAIDLAERNHQRIALLFLDLDGFKHVNDTLGHSLGDQLLQETAKRLVKSIRKTDTVSRFGGDEFSIILTENIDIYSIEHTVNKLQKILTMPFVLDDHQAFISASIGITIYPDDGKKPETLLRKADSAMYMAKDKGRNNHQFFTIELDQKAQQRRAMESELRHAIKNNEFTLNYQPIIDSQSNRVVTAEALIRWTHPTKGLISPADFIPIAESVGLILPIGEWVLRRACQDAVKWRTIFKNPPRVAVNLSSVQFQRKNICEEVLSILKETKLPANQLILEITESLLMDDDSHTLEQLTALRNLGIDLSIDDFGTGYSSLSYLKKFPISILKIDRSFIMELTTNEEDKALVNAIISMAQSLKLKVTAEGVEQEEQANYLKTKSCEYIQGFYFSKPLTNQDFIDYVNMAR